MKKLGAIILAAGKGKRMQASEKNKVVYHLANKPMIVHTVELLEQIHTEAIVVVVGFAKESVVEALSEKHVIFTHQEERLGTGDAALCGLKALPEKITDTFIFYGDDSAFYTPQILKKLLQAHTQANAEMTFLTIEVENPTGLGRIVRDKKKQVIAIVEEKDASEEQKTIKEINPACYIFKRNFLEENLPHIEKSPITREYYLTSIIDMAFHQKAKMEIVAAGKIPWRGVNTPEELQAAEELYLQTRLAHS